MAKKVNEMRYSTCRYPDGERAWHWTNARPHSRRKAW